MIRGRLEAFSDGVLAIILTIMVLDLKVPASSGIEALTPLIPTFLGYTLSFIHVGIYWNNHHHTFQAVRSSTVPCYWRTCICCSGSRWSRSRPIGWGCRTSRCGLSPCTASCC